MNSEIKPVYQTLFFATEFPDGWHEVDKQVHDVRSNHPDQFKTRILYPAAALEASQNEVMKLQAENTAQAKLIAHQQFLIDNLMLEYCPDEMTEEQMENWKAHQRRVKL